jgi:hypothetical protein
MNDEWTAAARAGTASAFALSGLVLVLPPVLAKRFWKQYDEASDVFIGRALGLWDDA